MYEEPLFWSYIDVPPPLGNPQRKQRKQTSTFEAFYTHTKHVFGGTAGCE